METNALHLKRVVRDKYAAIARSKGESSCCGPKSCGCGETVDFSGDAYAKVEGYVPEADYGLGCGLPTEVAGLAPGQTVVDLGAGAGNDVFIARRIVGESGRVIGIDMTPEMIEKARLNAAKLGFANVEFRLGEIEAIPLPEAAADVVISNCVFNLIPDKLAAFREVYRVLKPGAHFCISDIVSTAALPPRLAEVAELYSGCVSGALPLADYLSVIREAGFREVEVKRQRVIEVPESVLRQALSARELADLRASGLALLSVTVWAERPVA